METETEFLKIIKPSGGSGYVCVPKRFIGRVARVSIQPDIVSPRTFLEALIGPKLASLIIESLENQQLSAGSVEDENREAET